MTTHDRVQLSLSRPFVVNPIFINQTILQSNITNIGHTNFNLQDATGRWTMEEIPNSEKVFKADLVIIAAGFLGPEKTLAEQFGLKKVGLLCFHLGPFTLRKYCSVAFI